MIAYVTWNIDPELLRIGPITVRWYGLMFAMLFTIGFLMVSSYYKGEGKSTGTLDQLLLFIIVGAIVGARLAHCLLYEPGYYLSHPLRILQIWNGGLASHGGAAGVLGAVYLYSRRHRDQPFMWVLDRIAVPAALGGAFIRVGNLFNSEILGRPADWPWAFVFSKVDAVPRHPVQLYEALAYLVVFIVLTRVYRSRNTGRERGLLFGMFLVGVFAARFFLEFFKERQASYEFALPLAVGQLFSIPFVTIGAWLIIRWWRRAKTHKKPSDSLNKLLLGH